MEVHLHYDVVDNEFGMGRQRVILKVYDQGAFWESTRPQYRPLMEGDYRFSTDWHTDADCLFKDGPILRLGGKPPAADASKGGKE